MKNFCIMTDALTFVEEHLAEQITQKQIAAHCYCSQSSLQKLFHYALHMGVGEYIHKRRLTLATRELVGTAKSIAEIALEYHYGSPEAFTRAFIRTWGCPPSVFRKSRQFPDLFPRILPQNEGENGMTRRNVDLTALYDVLKAKNDTYVLCFDMVGLHPMNQISYAAGDKALAEVFRRVDTEATEEQMFFRIGGDEFVLVTGYQDSAQAEQLANRILAHNGEPVVQDGRAFPVSVRVAAMRMTFENLRYPDVLDNMMKAIDKARDNNTLYYVQS